MLRHLQYFTITWILKGHLFKNDESFTFLLIKRGLKSDCVYFQTQSLEYIGIDFCN